MQNATPHKRELYYRGCLFRFFFSSSAELQWLITVFCFTKAGLLNRSAAIARHFADLICIDVSLWAWIICRVDTGILQSLNDIATDGGGQEAFTDNAILIVLEPFIQKVSL